MKCELWEKSSRVLEVPLHSVTFKSSTRVVLEVGTLGMTWTKGFEEGPSRWLAETIFETAFGRLQSNNVAKASVLHEEM